MKKRIDRIGIIILLITFLLFFLVTIYILNNMKAEKIENIPSNPVVDDSKMNNDEEKAIISNLYKEAKILYDVVNVKYKVSQDDTITINNIVYKKILNFDEVTNIFTENGLKKYLTDLSTYFAKTSDSYYLAGNLASYQTYYFRGDKSNIYVLDNKDDQIIEGIIYEKWTSNNKNTLASIKVVKVDEKWLIDEINILATE